jgi:hypothetical protein
LIVRFHDEFGTSDGDQACAQHAAEHMLRRDPHQTRYRLHGDRHAAALTSTILHRLRADDPNSS